MLVDRVRKRLVDQLVEHICAGWEMARGRTRGLENIPGGFRSTYRVQGARSELLQGRCCDFN